ncbi:hypothetical protein RR46_13589 [Papilio xuthus]|uniref:Uncharacterized protein n=1 Tax=Papilio xuthus TaxID=66420 RepID=A0A194PH44_PAPXU|nr:hypothetical protein RR46_13589 [Papilio xuthus]
MEQLFVAAEARDTIVTDTRLSRVSQTYVKLSGVTWYVGASGLSAAIGRMAECTVAYLSDAFRAYLPRVQPPQQLITTLGTTAGSNSAGPAKVIRREIGGRESSQTGEAAVLRPAAAPCRAASAELTANERFAKPSVMQAVPLPTRNAPEGKVERAAVGRPRAPHQHARRRRDCAVPSAQCQC